MAQQVIDLECPSCGAPANTGHKSCNYCGRQIIISTFNSVYDMPMPEINKYATAYRKALSGNPQDSDLNNSIGMCYLKLKLFDKAHEAFAKAIENNFDNPETFFYGAICLLSGKKAFLAARPAIDKIEQYINAAISLEPRGIFYYFWAYIKYDYFSRKSYNTSPAYEEALALATSAGLTSFDIEQLYGILGVQRPEPL